MSKSTQADVDRMCQSYLERAQYFTRQMNQIGLATLMPKGGLYCFTSIQALGVSSLDFSQRLVTDQQVAVVPGHVFGDCE